MWTSRGPPVPLVVALSVWLEENLTHFHLHRIGFEVHTGRRPFGLAGRKVKSPVELRTFDDVIHDEATREMDLCVCAQAGGGLIGVLGRPVDRKGASLVIEADHVCLFDLAGAADFNPGIVHG